MEININNNNLSINTPNEPPPLKPLHKELSLPQDKTKIIKDNIIHNIPIEQAKVTNISLIDDTYKVNKGDTLLSIAQKLYSDKDAWLAIFAQNIDKILDPQHLKEGIELKLPTLEEIQTLKKLNSKIPSPAEVNILARAIMAEARGENYNVKSAVATTIVNYSNRYDKPLAKLIKSSFLSSNFDGNKKFYTMPIDKMDKTVWKECLKASLSAFNGEGHKLIGDRYHFYDDSIRMPKWGDASTKVKIGSMYFLKSK